MLRYTFHRAVDLADNAVPGVVRRAIKASAPQLVESLYRTLARFTSDEATQVTVQSGPLAGRPFVCSLKQARSYFLGNHEPSKVQALARYATPGSTVLDCGGHIGYMSLVMATMVGPHGRVVAFEPDRRNFEVFERNLLLNPDLAARVTLRRAAISDGDGQAAFSLGSTTFVGHLSSTGEAADDLVETLAIDDVVHRQQLGPALLKIDIEGGEVRALTAVQQTLRTHRPGLVIELHSEEAHRVFVEAIGEAGYVARRVDVRDAWSVSPPWAGYCEYEARPGLPAS
jgi:FkbM family methyltransferase